MYQMLEVSNLTPILYILADMCKLSLSSPFCQMGTKGLPLLGCVQGPAYGKYPIVELLSFLSLFPYLLMFTGHLAFTCITSLSYHSNT